MEIFIGLAIGFLIIGLASIDVFKKPAHLKHDLQKTCMKVRMVEKPWGNEEIWAETDKYVGKILNIKAGHKLSLQYHKRKMETIRVLSGSMRLVLRWKGKHEVIIMNTGDVYHIHPYLRHRMDAAFGTDCKVLEVSTTELKDIVRLDDEYGRV